MADDQPEGRVAEGAPRRRLLLGVAVALLLALLAGAGAAATELSQPKRYRSSAVLLIDQEPALAQSRDAGLITKLASLRVKYADLVGTTTFSDALASDVGLQPGQVRGAVAAQVPPASLLVRVFGTAADAGTAQRLAAGAADKLQRDLASSQSTGADDKAALAPVTLTVVTPAQDGVRVRPDEDRALKRGLAAGGVVLLVGLALTAVAYRRV